MASARTSDHHPIPIQATRSGSTLITLPSPKTMSFPLRADRLHGQLGDPQIGLPIAAAHADAADAFAADQHGHAALHRRPAFRSGGEREANRMADVEVLAGSALRRGRTP